MVYFHEEYSETPNTTLELLLKEALVMYDVSQNQAYAESSDDTTVSKHYKNQAEKLLLEINYRAADEADKQKQVYVNRIFNDELQKVRT